MLSSQDWPLTKTLEVWVTPNASSNRIREEILDDGSIKLYVHLSVPAQDGKANKALIKVLAKELRVAKRAIKIISGIKCRCKMLEIKAP